MHTKEICISVEEGTLNHIIVKNFVHKYFSNVLTLSETLIIFHKDSEISQKKYFFQWLFAAYSKKRRDLTPTFLKSLQSAISFPIKVRITGKKRPVNAINIEIVYKNPSSFELVASSSIVKNYLRFRFRECLVASSDLIVRITDESIRLLDELMARKSLLAQPVLYKYKKIDLANILAGKETKKQEKHHFYSLIIDDDNKIKEAYRVLGCSMSASKDEIKRCYRKLALEYHPDRNHSDEAVEASRKIEMFHKIQSAYEMLR